MSADGFFVSETMCRTCLRRDAEKELRSFHQHYSQSYISILTTCVPIKVESQDGLPKNMCNKCLKMMLSFYKFRKMVLDNDSKVRRVLKENQQYIETYKNNSKVPVYNSVQDLNINTSINTENYSMFDMRQNDTEGCCNTVANFQIVTDSESPSESDELTEANKICNDSMNKPLETFQCEVCGKVLKSKGSLTVHIKNHTGHRSFPCDVCKKMFTKAEAVLIHKRIHTGERPHKCLICSKAFIQYSALKNHLRTHTGERPHMCSLCGKSFGQASSLTYHMKTHSDETPFICEVCNKGFKNRGSLTIHMRFHQNIRNFICEICDKRFVTSSYLKIHLRMHSGDKPHKCVVCGKAFLRSEHLKSHLVIHSGYKPYYCKMCPRRFTQNSHLKRHMKSHEQTLNVEKEASNG